MLSRHSNPFPVVRKEGRALGEVTKYLVYNARKSHLALLSKQVQRHTLNVNYQARDRKEEIQLITISYELNALLALKI
jgi:hypothetical protein